MGLSRWQWHCPVDKDTVPWTMALSRGQWHCPVDKDTVPWTRTLFRGQWIVETGHAWRCVLNYNFDLNNHWIIFCKKISYTWTFFQDYRHKWPVINKHIARSGTTKMYNPNQNIAVKKSSMEWIASKLAWRINWKKLLRCNFYLFWLRCKTLLKSA